jgi:hypothetical protein
VWARSAVKLIFFHTQFCALDFCSSLQSFILCYSVGGHSVGSHRQDVDVTRANASAAADAASKRFDRIESELLVLSL